MTDTQWARIEPLLPDRTPKRGGRWRDHRQVIDAMAFTYRTGTRCGSWRATPPSSVPASTPPGPVKRSPAGEPDDAAAR
ncbi:transposase [Streptomyces lydicus]|uniref:transposase n=1 Tax=Streptomyces lydicus TaxID=47763 RepID=UPI003796ED43